MRWYHSSGDHDKGWVHEATSSQKADMTEAVQALEVLRDNRWLALITAPRSGLLPHEGDVDRSIYRWCTHPTLCSVGSVGVPSLLPFRHYRLDVGDRAWKP